MTRAAIPKTTNRNKLKRATGVEVLLIEVSFMIRLSRVPMAECRVALNPSLYAYIRKATIPAMAVTRAALMDTSQ